MITRRRFLGGLVAAPAIVSAANIMPIWVPKWMRGKEDLFDMIYDISPIETPFHTAMGRAGVDHLWVVDELRPAKPITRWLTI